MKNKLYFLILGMHLSGLSMSQTIIDFRTQLKNYTVISDSTERTQGKSHGEFSYQNGIEEKKYYFFAFLDPQPNGAGFVSISIPIKLSLQLDQNLCLTAKGLQDKPSIFQLTINTSASQARNFSYQHDFTISNKKTDISFSLKDFVPTYRGNPLYDAPPLNTNDIQSIGIRIIGRVKSSNQTFQKGLYGMALYNLSIC